MLWQLPETFRFDAVVLDDFLGRLPRSTARWRPWRPRHDDKLAGDRALTTAETDRPVRHALEFRSPTLRRTRGDGACSDATGSPACSPTPPGAGRKVDEDTGPIRYVRLHGDQELYASGYTERALDEWAERCRGWAASGQDVFVYFDNDMKGFAPRDAMALIARLG